MSKAQRHYSELILKSYVITCLLPVCILWGKNCTFIGPFLPTVCVIKWPLKLLETTGIHSPLGLFIPPTYHLYAKPMPLSILSNKFFSLTPCHAPGYFGVASLEIVLCQYCVADLEMKISIRFPLSLGTPMVDSLIFLWFLM